MTGAPETLSAPAIRVHKGQRLLILLDGEVPVARFPVSLGFAPLGHKQAEGDGRTPEGRYYVCTRNDRSKFYLALGLSYPNGEDAREALVRGAITGEQGERIREALARRVRPPWDTPLGGAVMIHGMGGGGDWTHGCIAVDNGAMDTLWALCPLGTPVEILP